MPRHSLPRLARACAVLVFAALSSCSERSVVTPNVQRLPGIRTAALTSPPTTGIALLFDGSTSSAATANGAPVTTQTGDIKLEAWVKFASPTAAGQMIVYNGHTAVSGWGIFLAGNQVCLLAGGVDAPCSPATLIVGQWQHVSAERRADGSITLAVDGVEYALEIGANPLGGAFASQERTLVGRGTGPEDATDTPGDVFNGLIDDVRITTSAGAVIEAWSFDASTTEQTTGVNGATLFLRNIELVHIGTPVAIDVNPRQPQQLVDPERGGSIEVALLSGGGFDPTSVDESTVSFGPGNAAALRRGVRVDVDHDGDRDLLFTFDLGASGLTCMRGTATLAAKTRAGESLVGSDAVNTLTNRLPPNTRIVRCDAPQVLVTDLAPDASSSIGRAIDDRGEVAGTALFTGLVMYRWFEGTLTQQPPLAALPGTPLMNERGQIISTMRMLPVNPIVQRGFIWDGDALTDLGVDGTRTTVLALNKHGAVAGRGVFNGTFIYKWQDGVTTTLHETPERRFFRVAGLTDAGQAGGSSSDADFNSRIFLWDGTVFTDLSAPGPASDFAFAMNDHAQIVGRSANFIDFINYPTLWSPAGKIQLSDQPGDAIKINKHGEVVINSDLGAAIAVWRAGAITPLHGTENFEGFVNAFNDLGQAGGTAGGYAAFWDADGALVKLEGGQLRSISSSAVGMNNRGQVVGQYRDSEFLSHAVLWTITRR